MEKENINAISDLAYLCGFYLNDKDTAKKYYDLIHQKQSRYLICDATLFQNNHSSNPDLQKRKRFKSQAKIASYNFKKRRKKPKRYFFINSKTNNDNKRLVKKN